MILSDATTNGYSGSGSNGNNGALHVPHGSRVTITSTSDCLVLYSEHSLGETTEMQSV